MQILRGLVDDQSLQVLDCLNIFNIGIDQFALGRSRVERRPNFSKKALVVP